MITVSAPAKITLLGEHVVVYGKPALAAAINKRIYVKIQNLESKKQKDEQIIINTSEKKDLAQETIEIFKKNFNIEKLPSLEISIASQIPTGSGLGSSAALSAALLGALMKSVKNLWNPIRINELSYEVEKIAHGNPSGADNTTVVFGGLVWYRREFDFLKSIWNLPITKYKIPNFVIVDSGKPEETTKQMVATVDQFYKKNKAFAERIFSDQENQTKEMLLALKTGDSRRLIASIKKGEKNLEKIGVVGTFAQKIIRSIEKSGGAAKVCGAGGKNSGSGIILCYHKEIQKIKTIAEKRGLTTEQLRLGGEGIRIESQK